MLAVNTCQPAKLVKSQVHLAAQLDRRTQSVTFAHSDWSDITLPLYRQPKWDVSFYLTECVLWGSQLVLYSLFTTTLIINTRGLREKPLFGFLTLDDLSSPWPWKTELLSQKITTTRTRWDILIQYALDWLLFLTTNCATAAYGLNIHRADGTEGFAACVNPADACCHGFVASCTTSLLGEFGDSWLGLQHANKDKKKWSSTSWNTGG